LKGLLRRPFSPSRQGRNLVSFEANLARSKRGKRPPRAEEKRRGGARKSFSPRRRPAGISMGKLIFRGEGKLWPLRGEPSPALTSISGAGVTTAFLRNRGRLLSRSGGEERERERKDKWFGESTLDEGKTLALPTPLRETLIAEEGEFSRDGGGGGGALCVMGQVLISGERSGRAGDNDAKVNPIKKRSRSP